MYLCVLEKMTTLRAWDAELDAFHVHLLYLLLFFAVIPSASPSSLLNQLKKVYKVLKFTQK